MSNRMREEFEAWFLRYYIQLGYISSKAEAETIWQAAYRACMERSAEICKQRAARFESTWSITDGAQAEEAEGCEEAIRKEISDE